MQQSKPATPGARSPAKRRLFQPRAEATTGRAVGDFTHKAGSNTGFGVPEHGEAHMERAGREHRVSGSVIELGAYREALPSAERVEARQLNERVETTVDVA